MIGRALGLALAGLLAATAAPAETTVFPRSGHGDGELVIYSSTDFASMRAAIRDFQTVNPAIEVAYVDLDTSDLHRRFLDEVGRGAPSADLLISSAMDLQVQLVNDGHAAPHWSSEAGGVPAWAQWRNEAFGFTFEPAVIVYNRDLLPPDAVPQTRSDLLRLLRDGAAAFRGRIATYDAERSGVGYLLATQDAVVGGVFGSLLETFGQNEAVLVPNTSDILDGIASGQYLIGYNVLGSYAQAWADDGAPIGIVLPKDYTLTISRTAVLSAYAAHAGEAHRFLDYLLSVRGQRVLADQGTLFAVRPELTGPNSRVGISESRVGPLRSISLGPGLLVYLDRLKRRQFLATWREAVRQGRPTDRVTPVSVGAD